MRARKNKTDANKQRMTRLNAAVRNVFPQVRFDFPLLDRPTPLAIATSGLSEDFPFRRIVIF